MKGEMVMDGFLNPDPLVRTVDGLPDDIEDDSPPYRGGW